MVLLSHGACAGRSPEKPPSIVQLQLGNWIVPISNAPRPINPVAAVALSIGAAFAVGLLIAFGIIWTFS